VERGGIYGAIAGVSGMASAASFGIAGRIGRGHRAKVFARW
jgi:hypothetical protein